MKRLKSICLLFVALGLWCRADADNDLAAASRVAVNGMKLQSARLKVVSQNIASASTTGMTPGAQPYRRKIMLVQKQYDSLLGAEISVLKAVTHDRSDFIMRYEPNHPSADAHGIVLYPNVDPVLEMADAKEAQRSYEANLSSLEISKSNQIRLLEAMK
jgi:flagellar basal-body rod protein FlgC